MAWGVRVKSGLEVMVWGVGVLGFHCVLHHFALVLSVLRVRFRV